jgi:hypothetical protein
MDPTKARSERLVDYVDALWVANPYKYPFMTRKLDSLSAGLRERAHSDRFQS